MPYFNIFGGGNFLRFFKKCEEPLFKYFLQGVELWDQTFLLPFRQLLDLGGVHAHIVTLAQPFREGQHGFPDNWTPFILLIDGQLIVFQTIFSKFLLHHRLFGCLAQELHLSQVEILLTGDIHVESIFTEK